MITEQDLELLDDEFDAPTHEPFRRQHDTPVGSLTDNRRHWTPRRNAAVRRLKERGLA